MDRIQWQRVQQISDIAEKKKRVTWEPNDQNQDGRGKKKKKKKRIRKKHLQVDDNQLHGSQITNPHKKHHFNFAEVHIKKKADHQKKEYLSAEIDFGIVFN